MPPHRLHKSLGFVPGKWKEHKCIFLYSLAYKMQYYRSKSASSQERKISLSFFSLRFLPCSKANRIVKAMDMASLDLLCLYHSPRPGREIYLLGLETPAQIGSSLTPLWQQVFSGWLYQRLNTKVALEATARSTSNYYLLHLGIFFLINRWEEQVLTEEAPVVCVHFISVELLPYWVNFCLVMKLRSLTWFQNIKRIPLFLYLHNICS